MRRDNGIPTSAVPTDELVINPLEQFDGVLEKSRLGYQVLLFRIRSPISLEDEVEAPFALC